LLPLARAALEQMAGAGTLDRDAMADLAEVRWRSGDLEGAADAARAHQVSGGAEPLAALIIAEDLASRGGAAEARGYVDYVTGRVGGAVDQLFALEPRSPAWPAPDEGWMSQGAEMPGRFGLLVGGSEVATPTPTTWQVVPVVQPAASGSTAAGAADQPTPMGRGGATSPGGQVSTTAAVISGRLAGQELEMVDRLLASGDSAAAVGRLAVLLRLDPALAPVILSAADRAARVRPSAGSALPAIHLVRGDAYRILGRDNEAAAAYRLAHQALPPGPPSKEPS
jgi:hypothetical protein